MLFSIICSPTGQQPSRAAARTGLRARQASPPLPFQIKWEPHKDTSSRKPSLTGPRKLLRRLWKALGPRKTLIFSRPGAAAWTGQHMGGVVRLNIKLFNSRLMFSDFSLTPECNMLPPSSNHVSYLVSLSSPLFYKNKTTKTKQQEIKCYIAKQEQIFVLPFLTPLLLAASS